jgi:hypothetical protein
MLQRGSWITKTMWIMVHILCSVSYALKMRSRVNVKVYLSFDVYCATFHTIFNKILFKCFISIVSINRLIIFSKTSLFMDMFCLLTSEGCETGSCIKCI